MEKEIIHTFLLKIENTIKNNSNECFEFLKKNLGTFQEHQKILQDSSIAKDEDNEAWLVCQIKLKEHLHVLRGWLESEETDIRFLFTDPPWQNLREQHNQFIRNFEEQCALPYEEIAYEASVVLLATALSQGETSYWDAIKIHNQQEGIAVYRDASSVLMNKLDHEYLKVKKKWQNHLQGIKEEWLKDLELSGLQLTVMEIHKETLKFIGNKFRNKLIPSFGEIENDIGNSLVLFRKEDEIKIDELRKELIIENKALVKLLRQKKLPNLVDANSVEFNCQVAAEFYLPAQIDTVKLKRITYRAAAVSRYVYLKKPIAIIIKNEIHEGRSLLKIRLKAYVFDLRYEFAFASEMTELVIRQLLSKKSVRPEDLSLLKAA